MAPRASRAKRRKSDARKWRSACGPTASLQTAAACVHALGQLGKDASSVRRHAHAQE